MLNVKIRSLTSGGNFRRARGAVLMSQSLIEQPEIPVLVRVVFESCDLVMLLSEKWVVSRVEPETSDVQMLQLETFELSILQSCTLQLERLVVEIVQVPSRVQSRIVQSKSSVFLIVQEVSFDNRSTELMKVVSLRSAPTRLQPVVTGLLSSAIFNRARWSKIVVRCGEEIEVKYLTG